MFDKLDIFDKRYQELSEQLYENEIASDPKRYQDIMKEIASIEPIVKKYREYRDVKNGIDEALLILSEEGGDDEMRELAQAELDENKEKLPVLEEELKILLLPKDPNDDRSVIVEIRGGTGGEESSLFASDLYRMYSMYAEKKGFKIEG